jgi:hypothetical protein
VSVIALQRARHDAPILALLPLTRYRRQPQHHNYRPPTTTYLVRDNAVLMKDLRLGE